MEHQEKQLALEIAQRFIEMQEEIAHYGLSYAGIGLMRRTQRLSFERVSSSFNLTKEGFRVSIS